LRRSTSFSTAEAAKKLGISKQTLHRWFSQGRVADVRRDRNNWRVFTPQDIERIRSEANRVNAGDEVA
jgi:excisionase family DNA binding protein